MKCWDARISALQEAVHRLGPPHIGDDLVDAIALVLGQQEGKALANATVHLVRALADRRRGEVLCAIAAQRQAQLHQEQFVILETPFRLGEFLFVGRHVNPAERVLATDQAGVLEQRTAVELVDPVVDAIEQGNDDPLDLSTGEARRGRVDPSAEVQVRLRVRLVEHHELRIGHLQLVLVESDLARDHDRLSRLELVAHVRAMEPDESTRARLVTDDRLEHGRAPVVLIVGRFDQSNDAGRLIGLELSDLDRRRREDPIARVVLQQIRNGLDAQFRERLGPGRTDALDVLDRRARLEPTGRFGVCRFGIVHSLNSFRSHGRRAV